jgi:myo-inositol-1(or 4)-monophosphatase
MGDALSTARAAARAGAEALRARIGEPGRVRTKSSAIDLVSEADVSSGVAVVRAIAERVPSARFVVEEPEVYDLAGVKAGTLEDDEVWVIDPLDGTTSFVHGYPCWSVSVALLRDGTPVVGAVYNVPADELTSAVRGGGVDLDGTPVTCTDTSTLSHALLITGFPYDRGKPLDVQLAALAAFLRAPVHGIRRDGSAAVDCCHVACSRADGFWEFGLKPWDMAAGVVILEESGARVTDTSGAPWTTRSTGIVAANPRLQAQMLDVIARAAAAQ